MTTSNCDCCPPPADDPGPLAVAAGLAAITYRVGTQATFKQAMKDALAREPALARLTTRADDDPAIALIDAWACTLDVLTFYQERIANEGYLGTCTERRSVLELARAIGYELRPGVAASADLGFTLETAAGAPSSTTIDVATKVQSIPAQGQQAQVFETLAAIVARATWNALGVASTSSILPLTQDRRTIYLQGQATRLQAGDALVIVGDERTRDAGNENWDFRRVRQVRVVQPSPPTPDGTGSYTIVVLDRELGSVRRNVLPAQANPRVYALRTRASLFGHNAPDWQAMPPDLRATYLGFIARPLTPAQVVLLSKSTQWPGFSLAQQSDPPTDDPPRPGLNATTYAGAGFERLLAAGRVDATVDFGPDIAAWPAGVPATRFSARWTGWLSCDASGDHLFRTNSDDGVRLWIDERLLVDDWTLHSPTIDPAATDAAPLTLDAGRRYSVRLEYFQQGGDATIQLQWRPPGALAYATIPTERLDPRGVCNVKLDAVYPRFTAGSWVVLATPTDVELYSIDDAAETACADFAISAKSTGLVLVGENLLEKFNDAIRETAVFGDPEELLWAERPRSGLVTGNQLTLADGDAGLLPGQRIIVGGLVAAVTADPAVVKRLAAGEELAMLRIADDRSHATLRFERDLASRDDLTLPLEAAAETATVQPADGGGTMNILRLTKPLSNAYLPQSVRINANVASASHGDSRQMHVQPEVLGSGDGSAVFQSFDLKQAPLTYVSAANASGAQTTLSIRVAGVAWQELPSFYGADGNARVFTTRHADDGRVTVRFGDGITGARLPGGVENVQATYRVGIGAAGNVGPGQLSLLLTPQLGLKAVTNPLPAAGGTDAESWSDARHNAPLTVSTLDRIVSLLDFEAYAAAFTGIGKAKAVWLWNGQRQLVYLTVAGVGGAMLPADAPPLSNLRAAIDAARPPHQDLRIASGAIVRLSLDAQVAVKAGYLYAAVSQAVRAALVAGFGFEVRDFMQPLSGSEVVAAMQDVEGVDHVSLGSLGIGARRTNLLGDPIEARAARWDGTTLAPAELLLIDPGAIHLTEAID